MHYQDKKAKHKWLWSIKSLKRFPALDLHFKSENFVWKFVFSMRVFPGKDFPRWFQDETVLSIQAQTTVRFVSYKNNRRKHQIFLCVGFSLIIWVLLYEWTANSVRQCTNTLFRLWGIMTCIGETRKHFLCPLENKKREFSTWLKNCFDISNGKKLRESFRDAIKDPQSSSWCTWYLVDFKLNKRRKPAILINWISTGMWFEEKNL